MESIIWRADHPYVDWFSALVEAIQGTTRVFGVNQCCAVMSKPLEEAWNACIHIVTWLRDNYKTGLKFSSNGNQTPKIFYDSSHNQFTADSPLINTVLTTEWTPPTGWIACKLA